VHKLIHHFEHLDDMREGCSYIAPIHVSVWPTLKCQLKCSYCLCRNETGDEELDIEQFKKAVDFLAGHGTKAIEWSGGGEPLLWQHFEEAVKYVFSQNIKMSLITNGLELNNLRETLLIYFEWIRISVVSMKQIEGIDIERIKKHTRVSLSHIIPRKLYSSIFDMLDELHEYSKTHNLITRIAISRPSGTESENGVALKVSEYGDPFFMSHKEPGEPKGCYMAWIRAAIDWRGNFLPCPAVELSEESEGYIPDKFKLCHISELEKWLSSGAHDLGFRCSFCNCGKEINDFVHELFTEIEDVDFV